MTSFLRGSGLYPKLEKPCEYNYEKAPTFQIASYISFVPQLNSTLLMSIDKRVFVYLHVFNICDLIKHVGCFIFQ
jgi:hypothetical protein